MTDSPKRMLNERLLSVGEASRLPSAPTSDTIRNWILTGIKRPGDKLRVYLEHVYVGGRLYTSEEAYLRFIDRLNTPAVSFDESE